MEHFRTKTWSPYPLRLPVLLIVQQREHAYHEIIISVLPTTFTKSALLFWLSGLTMKPDSFCFTITVMLRASLSDVGGFTFSYLAAQEQTMKMKMQYKSPIQSLRYC